MVIWRLTAEVEFGRYPQFHTERHYLYQLYRAEWEKVKLTRLSYSYDAFSTRMCFLDERYLLIDWDENVFQAYPSGQEDYNTKVSRVCDHVCSDFLVSYCIFPAFCLFFFFYVSHFLLGIFASTSRHLFLLSVFKLTELNEYFMMMHVSFSCV